MEVLSATRSDFGLLWEMKVIKGEPLQKKNELKCLETEEEIRTAIPYDKQFSLDRDRAGEEERFDTAYL